MVRDCEKYCYVWEYWCLNCWLLPKVTGVKTNESFKASKSNAVDETEAANPLQFHITLDLGQHASDISFTEGESHL